MKDFKSVFEAYPTIDTIYVVDDMPFLTSNHAQSHSQTTGKDVIVVKKGAVKPEPVEPVIEPTEPEPVEPVIEPTKPAVKPTKGK